MQMLTIGLSCLTCHVPLRHLTSSPYFTLDLSTLFPFPFPLRERYSIACCSPARAQQHCASRTMDCLRLSLSLDGLLLLIAYSCCTRYHTTGGEAVDEPYLRLYASQLC
jgi:hypothetical protein